mgnify:CR=1 FL=1
MKSIATISITNCFTLLIIDIDTDFEGRVKTALYDGDTYTRPTWSKLRYDKQGNIYFIKYHRRYYLKEAMRTNI